MPFLFPTVACDISFLKCQSTGLFGEFHFLSKTNIHNHKIMQMINKVKILATFCALIEHRCHTGLNSPTSYYIALAFARL